MLMGATKKLSRVVTGVTALALAFGTVAVVSAPLAGASSGSGGSSCASPTTPTAGELNSTTGITKTSVTVGNVSIISGPVPGLFQGAPDGVKAYFNYINAQGGVNGRKLVLNSQDDGFSGTQNQAEVGSIVNSDFAEVGSFSLFDNFSCNVLAQNPAFSNISDTLDPGTNSLPNTFSVQPNEQGAPLSGYQYLKKKYPKDVTAVGTLVSDTATAISSWQGEEAALTHLGYKIAYVREISPLETNFTTDVINMKNAGVKMVYMTALDWQVGAALAKEMAAQNFHPIIFSGGPIYDTHFIAAAGGAKNVNGAWLLQGQALYNGQDAKYVPAVKTFDSWMAKTNPGFTPDLYSLFGWASAQLFVQALKAAGPNPTRGKLLSQLKQVTSFTASNLLAPANPAKKLPANCILYAQIINGNYQRVAPTAGPGWDCSGVYYSINGPLPKVNPPTSSK